MNKPAKTGGAKALVPRLRFTEFAHLPPWKPATLCDKDVGVMVDERVPLRDASPFTYVSTENLLPDFGGVEAASKLPPSGSLTAFRRGDILVANIRPYLKKVWHANFAGTASNDVIVIRALGRTSSKFLAAALRSEQFISFVMKGAKGIKMPRGDLALMSRYPVPLPSGAEQQKIADCLSSLDDLITAHADKLAALKQHKQGLLEQLFPREGETVPRLRFPEFRRRGGWEPTQVSHAFEVTRGYVLSMKLVRSQPAGEFKYPVFSSQTKHNGLSGYYDKFLYEDAITWTTDGANAGEVRYRAGKFYCTNVCGVLLSTTGYANTCIAELLNSVSRQYVSYVGNPKLMNGVMAKIVVPMPELAEQQKIAACLSALDTLITAQSHRLVALKQHKQGLLQQLFPVMDEAAA